MSVQLPRWVWIGAGSLACAAGMVIHDGTLRIDRCYGVRQWQWIDGGRPA